MTQTNRIQHAQPNPSFDLTISRHAGQRMHQRGISESDLDLVFQRATEVYNGGALFLYMRKRDIPDSVPAAQKERLEGLTVILSLDTGEVITIYKNRSGLKPILKKRKTNSHRTFVGSQWAA